MGVIYVRPNLINGKKYVGKAKVLKKRQNDWKNLNIPYAGEAINNARAKYGIDNFGFEILKECNDDELNYWEKYYIKELNTKAPNGYNLTDGGDGLKGYSPSEETRKKLSECHKGKKRSEEIRKKLCEANKGKHLSEETRKKISKAQKGRKLSEEHKRKLSESHKGKKLSQETRKKLSESRKGMVFSEEYKLNLRKIRKGRKLSEETKHKISKSLKGIPNIKLSKPVLQIDKNTNEVIAEFSSALEVQRQLGYSQSNISACCNEKPHYNSAYGFKWKYAV